MQTGILVTMKACILVRLGHDVRRRSKRIVNDHILYSNALFQQPASLSTSLLYATQKTQVLLNQHKTRKISNTIYGSLNHVSS